MQLIDFVQRETGETIACDDDNNFIYLASKKKVKKTIVDAAEIKFNEFEHKRKIKEIDDAVCAKIAELYSLTDEIKLLRTAPSEEFDIYNAHAEACRQWGKEQKALLQ